MLDFRDIEIVDKSFQLENTISENIALKKINTELIFIVIASILIICISKYTLKKEVLKENKTPNKYY